MGESMKSSAPILKVVIPTKEAISRASLGNRQKKHLEMTEKLFRLGVFNSIFLQIIFSLLVSSWALAKEPAPKVKGLESPKCTITSSPEVSNKNLNRAAAAPSLSLIPTPKTFPTYLKLLTNSERVALGPVGYAASCNKECEAYLKAFKANSSIRKELNWMVKNATPAGKLYAAILIRKFDNKAGEEALKTLQIEEEAVSYSPGGCVGGSTLPLKEHVKQILQNPNY